MVVSSCVSPHKIYQCHIDETLFFSEVDEVVQCLQSKAPEEMLLWALVRLIVIVQRTFYALFLRYFLSIWRVLKMAGLDDGLSKSNED